MQNSILNVDITALYKNCVQCPRQCQIDRFKSKGFCLEQNDIRLAVACLHFGEEPLLTVHGGSGTIFITGCNLRCAFCQNYQISQQQMGSVVSLQEFSDICLRLENIGAENINIVTGSHHAPQIAQGLALARKNGLKIPICWNSSGYDEIESLKCLEGLVDIYLPDLKTLSKELSTNLCAAGDYPLKAKDAIRWMIKHNPLKIETITKDGISKDKIISGVIVRHLFLPGRFFETADVLEWLKQNADGKAIISLMSQYTPVPFKGTKEELLKREQSLKSIENRLVNKTEDQDLRDIIEAYDFNYLFYQDLCSDTEWLPDFTKEQPFSYKLAKPVWHWQNGFVSHAI